MTASANNRLPLIPILAILFACVAITAVGLFSLSTRNNGYFYAGGPTPTPRPVLNDNPLPIAFTDLDSDPFALRDQYIRVTGRFAPQTPVACVPNKGPRPRWGLIAEGLQMDGTGLRDLGLLVPEGAEISVDGVWRLYEGPLGCGKEPPSNTLWYLEAQRVYQPNPLIFDNFVIETPLARVGESGTEETTGTPDPTTTVDPNATATTTPNEGTRVPTTTPTPTNTAVATRTPTPTITPSPTQNGNGAIASPTPLNGNATATSTTTNGNGGPASPTPQPSATPSDGTGTPAPTATGPSGVPTSPPGTVVPSTVEPTNTPPGYGGGGNGGYP